MLKSKTPFSAMNSLLCKVRSEGGNLKLERINHFQWDQHQFNFSNSYLS